MKICVSKNIYASRAQKKIPKTALIESRVLMKAELKLLICSIKKLKK